MPVWRWRRFMGPQHLGVAVAGTWVGSQPESGVSLQAAAMPWELADHRTHPIGRNGPGAPSLKQGYLPRQGRLSPQEGGDGGRLVPRRGPGLGRTTGSGVQGPRPSPLPGNTLPRLRPHPFFESTLCTRLPLMCLSFPGQVRPRRPLGLRFPYRPGKVLGERGCGPGWKGPRWDPGLPWQPRRTSLCPAPCPSRAVKLLLRG